MYIWPKSMTLKKAPIPTELRPSLPSLAIHCASKFCWERYPVKAVPIAIRKTTAPVTQVQPLPPRQAPMKNLPQRCTTMAKKNTSTDQRWTLLKNFPTPESCHQAGPFSPRITPEPITTTSAAIVATPNT